MTKEELQYKWDELLMQARFFCPDVGVRDLTSNFKLIYGEYPSTFGLKRVPKPIEKEDGQLYFINPTVLRFICAYIPKLANYCWKFKKEQWQEVLTAITKCSWDSSKNSNDGLGVEFAKRRYGRDTSRATAIAAKIKKEKHENYEAHLLSNQWSVCK